MNISKDIPEYIQCYNCKEHFPKEDIVKVLSKPSFLQMIQKTTNYNLLCKGCINHE